MKKVQAINGRRLHRAQIRGDCRIAPRYGSRHHSNLASFIRIKAKLHLAEEKYSQVFFEVGRERVPVRNIPVILVRLEDVMRNGQQPRVGISTASI